MLGLEKFLNEVTLILTIITMVCVILLKKQLVSIYLVIFLCILTLLVYLCSRVVNSNNSKLSSEDKSKLKDINESIKKKGKKKDGKKNSSNSR